MAPLRKAIFANGLAFGDCNSQGTMNVIGADNIRQYALRLGE